MSGVPRGHFSRSRPLADYDIRFGMGVVAQSIRSRGDNAQVQVLEIGCGEGRVLMELRKLFPAIGLHGINREPWPAMQGSQSLPDTATHYGIFDATELAGVQLPAIHFYDAAELRFPDAYFDVVISQVTIPYVARKDRLIEEVWRTLKTGGIAFLQIDATRKAQPDFLAGDAPCFVLYQRGNRVPAAVYFSACRDQGFDLDYRVVQSGKADSFRYLLVMRKMHAAPLRFGLAFDVLSSFDLLRLHDSPQSWEVFWGFRSVFHIPA